MDTQNEVTMATEQVLAQISGQRVVAGAKQLRKALQNGQAGKVFLACNADPVITEPLLQLCVQTQTPYAWVRTMADLGRACGIRVGAAAAATLL